jgi:hypothetical protein
MKKFVLIKNDPYHQNIFGSIVAITKADCPDEALEKFERIHFYIDEMYRIAEVEDIEIVD